jgi:aromatic-L-amino-acid decarboxylase
VTTAEPSTGDVPADLTGAQLDGLGDMEPEHFRAAAHAVVDLMADYLSSLEERAVFPHVQPGAIRAELPARPPEDPEPLSTLLADYQRLVEPNATHWQHPGFLAYFSTTASGPGILGEMLTAAIGQNPMIWRTSPVGTELEQVVVHWLRQAVGLRNEFDGLITDTASTSSLIALAAAREAAGLSVASDGLAGRADVPQLRVYLSTEAHSSIDKACMTLGLGRSSLVHVAVDDEFAMRPEALQQAIADDRAAGRRPLAIVATIGTTSSTSVDPVGAIAEIARREALWFHVDAAYAGPVALIPERRTPFAGWERADSIVINPHKWLFTPLDASLLLTKRMESLRAAFSLSRAYLQPPDGFARQDGPTGADELAPPGGSAHPRDYSDFTPQLGRRFRALKLWLLIRWFGLSGLRRRIDRHIALAEEFAAWVDADPDFERLAAVPFSTVCFRYRPQRLAVSHGDPAAEARLDALNARLIEAVNGTGEVFLSHTRLGDRYTLRVAIGNLRTEERHVARAWELLRREAAALDV